METVNGRFLCQTGLLSGRFRTQGVRCCNGGVLQRNRISKRPFRSEPSHSVIGYEQRQDCRVSRVSRIRASSGASPEDVSVSDLPDSLEESVTNACSALRTVLSSTKGEGKKGKKGKTRAIKSVRRLGVEVPVLDTSVETLTFLAASFANELGRGGRVSVVFADEDVAQAGKDVLDASVVTSLEEASVVRLTERLLVVAPQETDMDSVFDLIDENWRGEAVVLVNPEWGQDFLDENKQFCDSFDVVYSFLPLAVQGMLGTKEGAMLRWVKEKNKTVMWRIFVKERDGGFKCVGRQATRPADSELELAMYNASAADSPVTQGIKFVRNLVGGGGGGGR
ncbi:hypothetical protein BSKO_01332 [Bryopsis sp. KO-2023]|nr:hypothetical protein BSKO_01332 [Bryopsis sp. KO-2023]